MARLSYVLWCFAWLVAPSQPTFLPYEVAYVPLSPNNDGAQVYRGLYRPYSANNAFLPYMPGPSLPALRPEMNTTSESQQSKTNLQSVRKLPGGKMNKTSKMKHKIAAGAVHEPPSPMKTAQNALTTLNKISERILPSLTDLLLPDKTKKRLQRPNNYHLKMKKNEAKSIFRKELVPGFHHPAPEYIESTRGGILPQKKANEPIIPRFPFRDYGALSGASKRIRLWKGFHNQRKAPSPSPSSPSQSGFSPLYQSVPKGRYPNFPPGNQQVGYGIPMPWQYQQQKTLPWNAGSNPALQIQKVPPDGTPKFKKTEKTQKMIKAKDLECKNGTCMIPNPEGDIIIHNYGKGSFVFVDKTLEGRNVTELDLPPPKRFTFKKPARAAKKEITTTRRPLQKLHIRAAKRGNTKKKKSLRKITEIKSIGKSTERPANRSGKKATKRLKRTKLKYKKGRSKKRERRYWWQRVLITTPDPNKSQRKDES